jgi:hypothetical protein
LWVWIESCMNRCWRDSGGSFWGGGRWCQNPRPDGGDDAFKINLWNSNTSEFTMYAFYWNGNFHYLPCTSPSRLKSTLTSTQANSNLYFWVTPLPYTNTPLFYFPFMELL